MSRQNFASDGFGDGSLPPVVRNNGTVRNLSGFAGNETCLEKFKKRKKMRTKFSNAVIRVPLEKLAHSSGAVRFGSIEMPYILVDDPCLGERSGNPEWYVQSLREPLANVRRQILVSAPGEASFPRSAITFGTTGGWWGALQFSLIAELSDGSAILDLTDVSYDGSYRAFAAHLSGRHDGWKFERELEFPCRIESSEGTFECLADYQQARQAKGLEMAWSSPIKMYGAEDSLVLEPANQS